jgi:hypothetical protein
MSGSGKHEKAVPIFKSIPLKTRDGLIFEMSPEALALSSILSALNEIREFNRSTVEIPVDMESTVFAKVVNYCEHYIHFPMETIEKVTINTFYFIFLL